MAEKLLRVCIRLKRSDYEKVQHMGEVRGVPSNHIIRECIASYIRQVEAIERRNLDKITPPATEAAQ